MNYYQFDNPTMDEDFLSGKAVLCKAVLTSAELKSGKITQGQKIVILLSNRKKFMGIVGQFKYTLKDDHAVGLMEVRKA